MSIYAGLSLKEIYVIHCKERRIKSNSDLLRVLSSIPDDFSSLRLLDISQNYLGPKGIKPLLPIVECCTSLAALNFSSQNLDKESLQLLCATLHTHPSVVSINLSNNPLNITAGVVLLDFCRANTNIEEVLLYNTQIRGTIFSSIQEQTESNRREKSHKETKSSSTVARKVPESQNGITLLPTDPKAIICGIETKENTASHKPIIPIGVPSATGAEVREVSLPAVALASNGKQSDLAAGTTKKRIAALTFKDALMKAEQATAYKSCTSPSPHPFLLNVNPLPALNEVCENSGHYFYDFQFPADDKATQALDAHVYEFHGFKRLTDVYRNVLVFPDDRNDDDLLELPDSIASGFHWIFTCIGACVKTYGDLKKLFLLPSSPLPPFLSSAASLPSFPHDIREENTAAGSSKWSKEQCAPSSTTNTALADHEEKDEASAQGSSEVNSPVIVMGRDGGLSTNSSIRNGLFGIRIFVEGAWRYVFADDFIPVDYHGTPVFTKAILSSHHHDNANEFTKEGSHGLIRPVQSEMSGVGSRHSEAKKLSRASTTSSVGGSRSGSSRWTSTRFSRQLKDTSTKACIWPCLLEKILAKLLGGYNALDSNVNYNTDSSLYHRLGRDPMYEEIKRTSLTTPRSTTCAKLMGYVTGGVSIVRQLHMSGFDADGWWKTLEALLGAELPVMAVAVSRKPSKCLPGIDPSQAYAICQARQVNGFRLVELHCPVVSSSWHGRWSEESPEWDHFPAVDAILRRGPNSYGRGAQRNENLSLAHGKEGSHSVKSGSSSGTVDRHILTMPSHSAVIPQPPAFLTSQKMKKCTRFWMSYVDFLHIFESVHICRTFDGFHERFVEGEWNCRSAGGSVGKERWRANPHFRLRLSRTAPCFIHLELQDRCFSVDGMADSISFHIIKSPCFPLQCLEKKGKGSRDDQKAVDPILLDANTLVFQPCYYCADSLYFEGMLNAADDHWIVPSTFTEGLLDRFLFRICSPSSFILSKESMPIP